ncbi:MAG TPA: DNA polymerase IV, partial [Dehalococcoidia bacterium]|nr:DNA polymerase IV [Dehalococcoidia bacterium]
ADLDAFYASVEQRDDPALRGLPVVVGGAADHRGVVAAASYEARRFGVRSAMAMSRALRLCPEAVRLPARFSVYAEVSAIVLGGYRGMTPLVEPLSLDEAYLDLSDVSPEPSEWASLARRMKDQVREAVDLPVSVGVSTSKSVAKIASDLEKPDGLVVVPPGKERDFLAPLPVGRLWGVGPRGEERMASLGVRTIGELAQVDVRLVSGIFGRWGTLLHDLANGADDRPVQATHETKSVARERTFAQDLESGPPLQQELRPIVDSISERLRRRGLRGRTVTLKLRQSDFTTFTRQRTLPYPVDQTGPIYDAAADLLAREARPGQRYRLLGVSLSGFDEPSQLPLPL